jgi:hypothetical protein
MMGTSIPNKSHTGVRNMALLPARLGALEASLSIGNIMPPTDPWYIGIRPTRPSVCKGSSANFDGSGSPLYVRSATLSEATRP